MSEPVAWMQTSPGGKPMPIAWEFPLTEAERAAGWTERALVYADDLDACEARCRLYTAGLDAASECQDKMVAALDAAHDWNASLAERFNAMKVALRDITFAFYKKDYPAIDEALRGVAQYTEAPNEMPTRSDYVEALDAMTKERDDLQQVASTVEPLLHKLDAAEARIKVLTEALTLEPGEAEIVRALEAYDSGLGKSRKHAMAAALASLEPKT